MDKEKRMRMGQEKKAVHGPGGKGRAWARRRRV